MDVEEAASKAVKNVSGKWTVEIIFELKRHPRTFTEISSNIEDISNKMMSNTLNELNSKSLVEKPENDKGYKLTEKGVETKKQLKKLGEVTRKYDGNGKILIVEDDEDQAKIYSTWLEGLTTETVKPGEILEKSSENVEAVMMDRDLGQETSDKYLKHLGKADVPVIICSGVEPSLEDLDMPFYSYQVKPVDKESLKDTVEEIYNEKKENVFVESLKNKKELIRSRSLGSKKERAEKIKEFNQEISSSS